MTPFELARLVLAAQKAHEESYIESEKRYALDYMDAAIKVCPPEWAYPIGMLNAVAWNDIQAWAEAMASEKQRRIIENLRQYVEEGDSEDYVESLTAVSERLIKDLKRFESSE